VKFRPLVLLILDGWGIAEPSLANGITSAEKPVMDRLEKEYFSTTLQASGEAVGLDWGEMGNSEVGHMNIGSGRIVYQDIVRINNAIRNGSFFRNEAFLGAMENVKKNKSNLHILGLVSSGKVHSYNEHLYALIDIAKQNGVENVYIHAILDGRDAPPRSALGYIDELENKLSRLGIGKIVTIAGRWYTMDRDERWERIQLAYDAMVAGDGSKYESAHEAIEDAYNKELFDDRIPPVVIESSKSPFVGVRDNDSVIFFNYRQDRARQITRSFMEDDFSKFDRKGALKNLYFVTMTDYGLLFPLHVAFTPQKIEHPLAHVLADKRLVQLHAAETEKFAHVTYFFDGSVGNPFKGEEYLLVHSRRDVADYDEVPEMSAHDLTERVLKKIATNKYDFILVNYANPDMVGHTGNFEAIKKAINVVDVCVGKVVELVLSIGGAIVITADHGNAEHCRDLQTGRIDKEHTANAVPFVVVAKGYEQKNFNTSGIQMGFVPGVPFGVLSDVAPTILKLMKLEDTRHMTGRSLI